MRYPEPQAYPADRAYYYTSMPDENELEVLTTRLNIREIGFEPCKSRPNGWSAVM